MITDKQIQALGYKHFINKGEYFYAVLEMITGNGRLVVADLKGIKLAWCYTGYNKAVAAMLTWDIMKTDEPIGWVRSVFDGRRRENGDPNKETVLW